MMDLLLGLLEGLSSDLVRFEVVGPCDMDLSDIVFNEPGPLDGNDWQVDEKNRLLTTMTWQTAEANNRNEAVVMEGIDVSDLELSVEGAAGEVEETPYCTFSVFLQSEASNSLLLNPRICLMGVLFLSSLLGLVLSSYRGYAVWRKRWVQLESSGQQDSTSAFKTSRLHSKHTSKWGKHHHFHSGSAQVSMLLHCLELYTWIIAFWCCLLVTICLTPVLYLVCFNTTGGVPQPVDIHLEKLQVTQLYRALLILFIGLMSLLSLDLTRCMLHLYSPDRVTLFLERTGSLLFACCSCGTQKRPIDIDINSCQERLLEEGQTGLHVLPGLTYKSFNAKPSSEDDMEFDIISYMHQDRVNEQEVASCMSTEPRKTFITERPHYSAIPVMLPLTTIIEETEEDLQQEDRVFL